jgi:hypothetical protein
LIRLRTLLAICALALPVPAVLAGCGGGDSGSGSDEDPQTVLDETFSNDQSISSGNLNLTAGVDASGDQGGSFHASLTGPFQGEADNPQAIPQLDWTATLKGEGGGESIDFTGGLVVTDDNAYVEYNDKAYEVGADAFKQVKDQLEAQAGSAATPTSFAEGCKQALEQAGATDTSGCDIDLESWLTNLSNEGTADVGGTPTVHISGDLDVNNVLTDLGNLVSAFPGASSSGFDPSQLGAFSDAVTDASMDVYSGEDDHLLRKLDLHLTIDPKAIAGGAVAVPIDNIDISFGLELTDVNSTQTISAPANAQPISQLLSDLGVSPSDLGAIPGLGGSSLPGGSGSSGGKADDYFQCLQQAGTDPQEINKCASEL